jgi:hypothetical protein
MGVGASAALGAIVGVAVGNGPAAPLGAVGVWMDKGAGLVGATVPQAATMTAVTKRASLGRNNMHRGRGSLGFMA